MVEHVQGIEAELERFRFVKLETFAQVRIEPVLTGRVQAKRHVAVMSRKWILEDDGSSRAIGSFRSNRLQRTESTVVQKVETHLVGVVGYAAGGALLIRNRQEFVLAVKEPMVSCRVPNDMAFSVGTE